MKFDMLQYAKSSATLKRKQYQIRLEPGNRAALLEHETVEIPGRFIEGRLESWSVNIRAGSMDMGFGRSTSLEVIGSGATREEAIEKAEAHLRNQKES